jgi:drug/metabolite transporter (DMT)-like permease
LECANSTIQQFQPHPRIFHRSSQRGNPVDDCHLHPLFDTDLPDPGFGLAFWRDLFVALTLLPVLALFHPGLLRVERKDWHYLVIYGLVLAIFNSLWTLSVALNGAAISTVLAYCSAGFTALLGWWLLKERLDWAKIVAVTLSLGGCVLVADALNLAAWSANFIGILTGILSGLLYAIYSLMGRSASQRNLNPWTTLLYTFGFAAAFLLLFNLLPVNFCQARLFKYLTCSGWETPWPDGVSCSCWLPGPTLAGFGCTTSA